MIYIALYLLAAILANLSATLFGPISTVVNAFLFIGLDLTSRDKLHDHWHGHLLLPKMATLIFAGSLLSWLINRGADKIAVASFISFMISGFVDTIIYHILRKKPWLIKSNGSNIFSALVDSIIFPTIAFGSIMPLIIAGQFAAKVFGGGLWSIILKRRQR